MGIAYTETRGIVLRLERRFAAPREHVFEAWTTPEALKRWWCPPGWQAERMEVDLRVSGAFHLGMRRMSDGSTAAVEGRFLEVQRPERLVYTWRWTGTLKDMSESRVTVEFVDEQGDTRLTLTHDRLPDIPLWHRHRAGWIAACDRMEDALQGARTSILL
jgi:uncharacterized protein YndB with AHSA1/START domain